MVKLKVAVQTRAITEERLQSAQPERSVDHHAPPPFADDVDSIDELQTSHEVFRFKINHHAIHHAAKLLDQSLDQSEVLRALPLGLPDQRHFTKLAHEFPFSLVRSFFRRWSFGLAPFRPPLLEYLSQNILRNL